MKRLAIFFICTLSACRNAPEVDHPDLGLELPASFGESSSSDPSEGAIATRWWLGFDDDELTRYVDEAFRGNRDLRATAARFDRAVAQARIAGADQLPKAGISFDALRTRRVFIGFPFGSGGVPSSTNSQLGLSLNLSWELDLWGRIRSGRLAAGADAEAAAAELQGAAISLAGQVAKSWFALVEARRQLALAESTVKSYDDALGVVADRVEAGVSSELDLRLLRSERSTAEANRERRRTELAREVRSFEILIGRYPKGTLSSGSELPELSKEIPGGIPAQLLGRRPDIAVAERDLAAADARVYAAKASLLPRISLTASGGTSSDELADLLSGDFLVWQLAANVLQPVFEGGKLLAQVDESQATRDEALELYANTVLQAFAEVETALAVERFLAAEEEKTKRSVDDAQEAVRLSETRYGEGVESLLFVLESRRSLVASASRWVEVRLERLKNRVDLYLALGGGYGAEAARKDVAESPADSPEPKTSPKTVIEG